jgi:hypothetical protein
MLNIYEELRLRNVKSEFVKQCSINVGTFEVFYFVSLTSVRLYYPLTVFFFFLNNSVSFCYKACLIRHFVELFIFQENMVKND